MPKVHFGKNGGAYVMKAGKRKYISQFGAPSGGKQQVGRERFTQDERDNLLSWSAPDARAILDEMRNYAALNHWDGRDDGSAARNLNWRNVRRFIAGLGRENRRAMIMIGNLQGEKQALQDELDVCRKQLEDSRFFRGRSGKDYQGIRRAITRVERAEQNQ